MTRWPLVQLRHVARLGYGDALAADLRADGAVPVFGSNGKVGTHAAANTIGPTIVVGRKGSHGRLQFSETAVFAIDTTYFIDARMTQQHLRWLYYALQTVRLEELSQDVGVPGLNREDAYGQRVPVPHPRVQRAIADFLDTETVRIDALIAKKHRMVDLLSERFRAGVEARTLEGTPVRVRYLVSLLTSGPRGWSELAAETGQPFVRSANLMRSAIGLRLDDLVRVAPLRSAAVEAARSRLREGDVVVGITGANTGWVGIAGSEVAGGFVSQHVALVRPAGVHPEWLAYSIFSHRSQGLLLGSQYGGTKQQLGLSELAELVINIPTAEGQESQVSALRLLRDRTERATTQLSSQIELLEEHRQALITAAVTGELDIPGTAT